MSFFQNIKYLYYKNLLTSKDYNTQRKIISGIKDPELAHRVFYYHALHKDLNLNNPKDFNEKIQYMMLYVYGQKESNLADKYLVRDFLKEKGFKNLSPKLYGVYNSPDEIDFAKLPKRFVLKCNHGCGDIEFCEDKSTFDINAAKQHLLTALQNDFSTQSLEPQYHHIKRKNICEEFLPKDDGHLPPDYKFYCFNGKVECILVCSEREKKLRLDYYDLNWNYLPYSLPEYRSKRKFEKPKNLSKMIKIASELSKGFPFVRVDLYNIDGKIYFSELTFTPAAAITYYNTQEALDHFGSLIKLPPKKHKPESIKLKY